MIAAPCGTCSQPLVIFSFSPAPSYHSPELDGFSGAKPIFRHNSCLFFACQFPPLVHVHWHMSFSVSFRCLHSNTRANHTHTHTHVHFLSLSLASPSLFASLPLSCICLSSIFDKPLECIGASNRLEKTLDQTENLFRKPTIYNDNLLPSPVVVYLQKEMFS